MVAGGLLDQPVKRFKEMMVSLEIYTAFNTHANYLGGDVAFSERHPDYWELVTLIETSML